MKNVVRQRICSDKGLALETSVAYKMAVNSTCSAHALTVLDADAVQQFLQKTNPLILTQDEFI